MRVGKTIKRIGLTVGALLLVFLIYRVGTVYQWRAGGCEVERAAEVPPAGPAIESLRVMTFNIEGHASLFDHDHIREIAEVINREKPDVVGLQEVHVHTLQARREDQITELEELTGMSGSFGPALHTLGGDYGNAVLTRGEIVSSAVYSLPGFGEPRALLRATVRIGGAEVDIFVAHLAAWGKLHRRTRAAQLACVESVVNRSPRPHVLVGDFNAPADADEISSLLTRELRPAGDVSASTHKITGQHLDYILIDQGWNTVSTHIVSADPSDHRPIVADLRRERTR